MSRAEAGLLLVSSTSTVSRAAVFIAMGDRIGSSILPTVVVLDASLARRRRFVVLPPRIVAPLSSPDRPPRRSEIPAPERGAHQNDKQAIRRA